MTFYVFWSCCMRFLEHWRLIVWLNCDLCRVGRKISDFMSTQNRLGHFGDVSQANLLANLCGKNKPDTTKACIRQSKEMYYNTKYTEKNNGRFSRLLRHPDWKRSGSRPILRSRQVREEVSKEKWRKGAAKVSDRTMSTTCKTCEIVMDWKFNQNL